MHNEDSRSESSEDSGEFVSVRGAGRQMDNCRICSKPAAKYRCPKCSVRTCSTFCCTEHKKQLGCTGVRTHTEFIPRGQYQQPQSRDDYKFLLQMMDGVDKVRKTLTGTEGQSEQGRFKLLQRFARQQYNCEMKMAPSIIERHRENISFYFVMSKEIFWMVEFLWYTPTGSPVRSVTDPINDKETLQKALSQQFFSSEMMSKWQINTTFIGEFRLLVKNEYNAKAVDMQASHIAKGKSKHQYIEVPLDIPLKEMLRNLTVFEFPTVLMLHEKFVVPFSSKNWVAFLPPKKELPAKLEITLGVFQQPN